MSEKRPPQVLPPLVYDPVRPRKPPVRMVRVGWMVVEDDGSGYAGRFYTRRIHYDILTNERGFTLTPVYARKIRGRQ